MQQLVLTAVVLHGILLATANLATLPPQAERAVLETRLASAAPVGVPLGWDELPQPHHREPVRLLFATKRAPSTTNAMQVPASSALQRCHWRQPTAI